MYKHAPQLWAPDYLQNTNPDLGPKNLLNHKPIYLHMHAKGFIHNPVINTRRIVETLTNYTSDL